MLKNIPNLEEIDKINEMIQDDEVLPISEIVKNQPRAGDRFTAGFQLINAAMNGGFKEGDLAIISGISGQGKTTLAQTITYHMTRAAVPCLWFSYEVTINELDRKFREMGISDHYIAYHPKKLTSGHMEWLKHKIRESWIKYACKVVFIDHIDFLVPMDAKKADTREIALKQIAIDLKQLAIQLNVVIVLMSHLKKIDDMKEPTMNDIGYSAGIFQNADYVFMVYRERAKKNFGEETGNIYTNHTKIKIEKNRETGKTIFIKAQYSSGKFIEELNINEPPAQTIPCFHE